MIGLMYCDDTLRATDEVNKILNVYCHPKGPLLETSSSHLMVARVMGMSLPLGQVLSFPTCSDLGQLLVSILEFDESIFRRFCRLMSLS